MTQLSHSVAAESKAIVPLFCQKYPYSQMQSRSRTEWNQSGDGSWPEKGHPAAAPGREANRALTQPPGPPRTAAPPAASPQGGASLPRRGGSKQTKNQKSST